MIVPDDTLINWFTGTLMLRVNNSIGKDSFIDVHGFPIVYRRSKSKLFLFANGDVPLRGGRTLKDVYSSCFDPEDKLFYITCDAKFNYFG